MAETDALAQKLMARSERMASDRAVFDSHWEQVRLVTRPDAAGFESRDWPGTQNRGNILDGTGEDAAELLAGALNGFLTNPGQKWFGLRAKRRALNRDAEVAAWLEAVRDLLLAVFESPESQFSNQIQQTYQDLVDFGTPVLYIADRPGKLPLFQQRPLGECAMAESAEGVVDTLSRRFRLTARQAEQEFPGRLPDRIVTALANGKAEDRFDFLHFTLPAKELKGERLETNTRAPFYSIWISLDSKMRVKERPFKEFPYVTPRWKVRAGEVYGRSPGMKALPDVQMLQRAMESQIRGVEKTIDPPLMVASDGILTPIAGGPKNINVVEADMLTGRLSPIQPLLSGARPDIGDIFLDGIRDRIGRSYFNHLLQLSRDPRMTATHVLKLDEESLRVIGPFLGRAQNELLGPMIARTYGIIGRMGGLPPLPAALDREAIEVEYVSPVAKAQRLSEATAYGQLFDLSGPMTEADQQVWDNLDRDAAYRTMAERLGVPKSDMRDPRAVARIRRERAEEIARQADAEELETTARAAQSAGQAAMAFKNAGAGTGPANGGAANQNQAA
jgi:hypothetical protein